MSLFCSGTHSPPLFCICDITSHKSYVSGLFLRSLILLFFSVYSLLLFPLLKWLRISSQLICLQKFSLFSFLLCCKPDDLCVNSVPLPFLFSPFSLCRQHHGAGVSRGAVVSSADRGRQHRGRIRGGPPWHLWSPIFRVCETVFRVCETWLWI